MKLFKIVPTLFRFLSLSVYWLFITSGSLLNEYRILQVFLLCFEVIGNDDSLSLAVCTCCLGNRLFAVFSRAFYGIAGLLPVSTVFMMLIFVQLAPENIWRGGSCQLGDVPPGKDY